EVLVVAPGARASSDGLFAERSPAARVVMLESLADGEVAGRADVAAAAAAREEPVRRPAPEAAQRRQRGDHIRARRRGQRLEVEGAAYNSTGEIADVLALARRVLQRAVLAQPRGGERAGGGKRVHDAAGRVDRCAPAPHEAGTAREGEGEVHLLGGDRADQHLERAGR